MLGLEKEGSSFSQPKVLLALLVIAAVFFTAGYLSSDCRNSGVTGAVTGQQAGERAVNFINNNMLQGNALASLVNYTEKDGLYLITLSVTDGKQDQVFESYVSKDGALLFVSGINITESVPKRQETQQPPQETGLPKSDKPAIELFVMSHCPYGTQIEKGMLPVAALLGDKIDLKVKFVYYSMHGKKELDEQLLQTCMEKEFSGQYLGYLGCFLKEGDTEACLNESGVDMTVLNQCINNTDEQYRVTELYNDQSTWLSGRFPLFNVDKSDNEKYGVRGSPTLVINGQVASSGRSPSALLSTICSTFNNPPEECSQTLASETPSPGFGFSTTSGGSSATCG